MSENKKRVQGFEKEKVTLKKYRLWNESKGGIFLFTWFSDNDRCSDPRCR